MSNKFDELMFIAIKESKNIEDILEKFFSFLRRHTDFCHTMLNEEELLKYNLDLSVNSKGFKPKQMINLVKNIIEDNIQLYRKSHQPYLLQNTFQNDKHVNLQNYNKQTNNKSTQSESKKDTNSKYGGQDSSSPCPPSELKYTINPWNGAITDKYAWSQSFREVTMEFVSCQKLTPKNVEIVMTKDRLKVKILDQVLVDGELCNPINSSDSVWSIEDGCRVLISIEKSQELWWDCVVKGGPTIDTQQIESVKRLDEFSSSEQNAILKMIKDHKEKNNMF